MTDVTGFLVNRLAERFRVRTSQALADLDLRPRQVGLLLVLRDAGTMPQHVLGEVLGIDRTTAMQFVTVLEARGIVRRRDDPSDRRVYVVSLTPAGRRLVSVLVARVAAVERTILRGLAVAEQRTLRVLLRTALEALPDDITCGAGEQQG